MSFDFYCCILPVQIARTTEPSIDYSTEYYDHDIILSNSGLIDNRQQIFGYFDHETLEVCLEVFTKKLEKKVKKFGNMASLKDLNEVKGIIEKTFEFAWKVRCSSCLCNCHEWSCKANGAFIPHYL